MTIRAVPCPKCRGVPVTDPIESGGFATYCRSKRCRNHLYCLGKTEDESKECWNNRIDKEDY